MFQGKTHGQRLFHPLLKNIEIRMYVMLMTLFSIILMSQTHAMPNTTPSQVPEGSIVVFKKEAEHMPLQRGCYLLLSEISHINSTSVICQQCYDLAVLLGKLQI